MLYKRYARDDEFVARFRREAQSAAALNHPHIVSIYDRGEAEDSYYIAMEYLEGKSLKEVIDRGGAAGAGAAPSNTPSRSCRRCSSPTSTTSSTATSSRTTSSSTAAARSR